MKKFIFLIISGLSVISSLSQAAGLADGAYVYFYNNSMSNLVGSVEPGGDTYGGNIVPQPFAHGTCAKVEVGTDFSGDLIYGEFAVGTDLTTNKCVIDYQYGIVGAHYEWKSPTTSGSGIKGDGTLENQCYVLSTSPLNICIGGEKLYCNICQN